MIVLDTHAVIWFFAGSKELGTTSLRRIAQALSRQEACCSAISYCEIAALAQAGRIVLPSSGTTVEEDVQSYRRKILGSGLLEHTVEGQITIEAVFMRIHKDPADRIIAATAKVLDATLVTADEKLLVAGVCNTLHART